MKFDHNAASLALCHARSILLLVCETDAHEDVRNAVAAAVQFVEDAKAMVDGIDRRQAEVPS